MPNIPNNLPAVGDKARLRGRAPIGIVKEIHANNWTRVWWGDDEAAQGPKFVHLHELEKISGSL